jgi:preprotein translocase subunit SecF
MFIIKYKKIFISLSIALVILSFVSMFYFGLKVGIDFKGGAITEIVYKDVRPEQDLLNKNLESLGLGTVLAQPTGEKGLILKSRDLTDVEHNTLLESLSLGGTYTFEETSFNSIGPSVGSELTRKAIISIILVALVIILFIAFAFRKVSRPVSSWKYGVIAVVTLLHDVIIPVGIFAVLSHYFGAEVDTLFVVAILTVLGLSVSDTIVIFDRIRENLSHEPNLSKSEFSKIVGKSLDQSFVRSIATSLTVIIVLLALVFWGPVTTKYFAMMLTFGMFFGTYSSIFLASPLLVIVANLQKKN